MKLLIVLIISFLASSVLFGQDNINSQFDNSSKLKSYAFVPVISDTIISPSKSLEIPKVNVGDIVGQLAASPISGIILALLGGSVGYFIEPTSHDGPSLPVAIGALVGYTVGSAIGVHIVARKEKYDPNLGILIGSSILGEIAGVYLAYRLNDQSDEWLLATLVLPPVCAIITLNAFQQKKSNITVGFDVQQLPQPNVYSYGMKLQYAF